MSKPFDATLNHLIDARPDDWARFLALRLGITPGPAEVLDTDLSTTLQSDKVFRLAGPPPVLVHLELEANPRTGIPEDLLRYNVLLAHAHKLDVRSVLLLLRSKANASDQSGVYRRLGLEFSYTVIQVWKESTETLLNAGPTLAPLALLTNEAATDLEAAFERFRTRLQEPDVSDNLKGELLVSTYVLSGLRYDESRIADLYRSVSMLLEDSTTYQGIIRKGETLGSIRTLQETLIEQGQARFGVSPPAAANLNGIADLARLQRMARRVVTAESWGDLLDTP